ncbi:HK97-gp10 family putative phage morphogenesis protein [Burkholderia sp. 22PA0099]|uniref:HK97-gp10 family putative phage morphogenesis protein n=1 Tax=unclassified Burkholderia TaxID=2613784 RepID=UPI0039C22F8C
MSVQVIGLSDLQKDLQKLAKSQTRAVLRKATVAGAKVLAAGARKRAPKETGKLRKNIKAAALKQKDAPGLAVAGVRVSTKGGADSPTNAFYWRFVELGTRYSRAEPFIRPAFDQGIGEAESAVRTEIARAIDKITGGFG